MPLIPINAAGQYGIVRTNDVLPTELPLNAWSSGQNVRMRDGGVEKFLGHQQVFGTPGTAPYFAIPVSVGGVYYWIYASLTKIYAWDGSSHTDITRAAGDYAATALRNWTGGMLGSIPILNNGVDVPQMWNPVTLGGDFTALSNWDANHRASAMRIFRRFIVAMNITKTGTNFPQMVKWSHSAPPGGGVPNSWDPADATKDAGEYELIDTDGAVVDGARMRDDLIVYKEDCCYRMQFVGGIDIFRFLPMFDNFGILSRRCAVEYSKGRHAVFAQGDIITHDGVSWESVITARVRRWLFNLIDQTNYPTSFIGLDQEHYEVWFCFPQSGTTLPNLAVVWNYQTGAIGIRDISATHISSGSVVFSSDTWDGGSSGSWDTTTLAWGEGASNPAGKRLLLCDPTNTKLFRGDVTNQFDGVNITSYIERTALPVPVKPGGPPNMQDRKFIKGLFPRISGTTGQTIKIYTGRQDAHDGSVTWGPPKDYVIGTTRFVDVRINTPLLALRFESTGDVSWKLAGYELDVLPGGKF